MNQRLLPLAAYDAGPSGLINLRNEAEKSGLHRDVWFDNVEVTAAQRIGRRAVPYHRAYRLAYEQALIREEARGLLETGSGEAER